MAKMELEELEKKQPIMEHDIQIELIPKDPNDEKNVVMEIRGAAGGDEGNIFAGDLFRMYSKYAESQDGRLKLKMLSLLKQEVIHLYHLLSREMVYILR